MINISNFLATLPIMLYGLAGIFAVILVIMLCVKLLITIFPSHKKENDQSQK